ncbi:hypothetical protein A3B56_03465 [Candidatus Roizmanbacteria bacterium RIFCSPLOWO2_01_FULL_45_11]|uniref:VWFA domain-containing protein n=1 Tax=Candidatus Roizmanbacteria bacterium RIFCSPLOWO2_01_FULL_45_11 TaxID=1802070 RepID=A0A1F7JF71_9BACT|nr:MAG: hypothetical protein A3B56_03465 [Candidatus Roizmanbacteria bacterium RIFCSPLOWO2_01_FULL_45_11]
MFYLFALISMLATAVAPPTLPDVSGMQVAYDCGLGNPDDLTIYRGDNTATLQLGSFTCPTPPAPLCSDVDIVFAFDRSGTMNQSFKGKKKLDWAKEGASSFVNGIFATQAGQFGNIRVGVVSYGSHLREEDRNSYATNVAWTHLRLTNDQSAVLAGINDVRHQENGTCIACGLRLTYEAIEKYPHPTNPNASKAVILLTDGLANADIEGNNYNDRDDAVDALTLEEAIRGKNELGINYYVIGYGDDRNGSLNEDIAQPDGFYTVAPNPDEWESAFAEIVGQICQNN